LEAGRIPTLNSIPTNRLSSDTNYAVGLSNAALACGSKVTFHFVCFSFFRSQSEKTKNKKKEKYRCE